MARGNKRDLDREKNLKRQKKDKVSIWFLFNLLFSKKLKIV